MIFRDLFKENPNHFYDWQAVKYYSGYNRTNDKDAIQKFEADWLLGTANLTDWLKNEKIDVDSLIIGLPADKVTIIRQRQHQLFDWWLEYKVRYKLLNDLQQVIEFAPWSVKAFANQKLNELEKHIFGERKPLDFSIWSNSLGLQLNFDYKISMQELSNSYENFDHIFDPGLRHEIAALLRCQKYLKQIIAEGIEVPTTIEKEETSDYISFSTYWPEILDLSRNLIIEYKTKHTYYDDQAYVSYQISGISGNNTSYGLKQKILNEFKLGFERLMTDLIKLDKNEQLDILNGLKDETEALGSVVAQGEYTEGGDEFSSGQRFEIKYFPHAFYKGDNDTRLATNEKSRLYLGKAMTEYPEAWLEAIAYMERKLEHAINNLELLNVRSKNPIYDVEAIFNNVFVIESAAGAIQGTAFHLEGVGILTCYHCVYDEVGKVYFNDLIIYRGKDLKIKYSVTVEKANPHVDIAILKLALNEIGLTEKGLIKGNSDSVKYLDDVAVAGFPNYNFGDTGYFTLGKVTGFRTISGISHVLVSNILVEGNSGGPAFDRDSNVIGIVVTGSETFGKSAHTEKHGLIPINAFDFLL